MTDAESTELKELGLRLRSLRQIKNFSQEKFAEITGFDRTYISGLERGKRNPSYLILKRLAEVLNISIEYLFYGEELNGRK